MGLVAPPPGTKGEWLAPEPRVKGVAFRTIEQCFSELCGARAHQKATELMAPVVVEAYRYGTLLPAGWYPISWYREVFRAFRAAASMGPELPRRIGSLAVRQDMKGAHKRLMAWLVSPQALLTLSQRVFSTYYDTGRLEVVATRKAVRCAPKRYVATRAPTCNAFADCSGAGSGATCGVF